MRSRPPNWGITRTNATAKSLHVRHRPRCSRMRQRPDPVAFGLARTSAPNTTMLLANPATTGRPACRADDELGRGGNRSRLASVEVVSIPPDDGVAATRVNIDPADLAWPARGTEKFLGRDPLWSQPSAPRKRRAWPDPVNLFGAAPCGRPKSTSPAHHRTQRRQAHPRSYRKKNVKNRKRGRNVY